MTPNSGVEVPEASTLAERYARRMREVAEHLRAFIAEPGEIGSANFSERFKHARRLLQGIAGSAGSFGYIAVSEKAQILLQRLDAIRRAPALDDDAWEQVRLHSERFRRLVEAGLGSEGLISASPITVAHPTLAPIYVVEDDADLGALIAERLGAQGFTVRLLNTMHSLEALIEQEPPAVILIDVDVDRGRLFGAQFAANSLVIQAHRIPMLFLSNHDDWEARLSALRAGGSGYLTKPIDFQQLAEVLDSLVAQEDDEPFRVLVLDDDVDLADLSATILRSAGMRVEVLNDPSQLLTVLPQFNPEVVLLDLLMPHASGSEVAALIRQRSPRDPLGIIVLSSVTSVQGRVESLLAGSDAYFPKPIDPDMLVAAVRGRARRARLQRAAMARDGLTGLNNHATVKIQMDELMGLCERNGRPLSIAMIDVDHFKQVNDVHGHLIGDRVLASLGRLLRNGRRRMDVVGRYGGEEFVMVLPDTQLEAAAQVLERLRLSFERQRNQGSGGEFSVTFSAGLALARANETVDQLIARADKALYEAKHAGRNRIELAR